MGKKDPRIDAYIDKAAAFAKPVLNHIREIVHKGCPEVEETMKWSFPHFMHKGILCNMAAFKGHCSFGFWKGSLIFKAKKTLRGNDKTGMGHFGRITSVADLPNSKTLIGFVKEATRLNDEGTNKPSRKSKPRPETVIPEFFKSALKRHPKALETFEAFSYSHKKEYVEWVTEAKREETRQQRIGTAIEWLAEGKSRHWKYAKC